MSAQATLLLPASSRFGGATLTDGLARMLGRADRLPDAEPGRRALLARQFRLIPNHWPVAALTRDADAGDGAGAVWLRADPCHVRADINGARLLGWGDSLAMGTDDAEALLPALRPLFGDAGLLLDAPVPSRWYLRLPTDASWPYFAEPDDVLGADLFEHLPSGPEGRRWRALLSEAQVLLHNHAWNARRQARGRLPVNSLWFWGGGRLPDHVEAVSARYSGDDELGISLAHAAGTLAAPQRRFSGVEVDTVFDLVGQRDLAVVERDWLAPALAALRAGALSRVLLDSEDGLCLSLARKHRWRAWRGARNDFTP